jgi:hypothetical protein
MSDFLTFNSFITQNVLIFFYYVGAVGVPFLLWLQKDYLVKKLRVSKDFLDKSSSLYGFLFLFIIFLMMELFWRMMFEAMIGYFDMHDYLYEIAKSLDK